MRYDLAIVGSGPAGLATASHAHDNGLSYILLERTDHLADTIYSYQARKFVMAEPTAPQRKITMRKRTIVGSLTPDDRPDSVYPLLDAECVIGRASTNAIAIADASISSNHARITRTGEGFILEDLQSRNGSFVNGERVTAQRLRVDGDLIRLGKVIMTFNVARETKAGETTEPEVRMNS